MHFLQNVMSMNERFVLFSCEITRIANHISARIDTILTILHAAAILFPWDSPLCTGKKFPQSKARIYLHMANTEQQTVGRRLQFKRKPSILRALITKFMAYQTSWTIEITNLIICLVFAATDMLCTTIPGNKQHAMSYSW